MAGTLSAFVTIFLDKLTAEMQEEVSSLAGVKSEVESLEKMIKEIVCLLADAESKAFYSESIRLWLKELKDVMYDADDVIDDCRIDRETASPSSLSQAVRTPLLSSSLSFLNKVMFRHRILKRLRSISSRVQEISEARSLFQLTPHVEDKKLTRINHQSSSLVEADLAGAAIQIDSRKLIRLLVDDCESRGNCAVVGITGMGGIGKTTLAQVIYNSQLIAASFQMKMWVCVSKDFAEVRLLREIIECAGGDPGRSHSKEQLELTIVSLLQGKKLFLVLDDIWSAKAWGDLLQNLLRGAAAGSRILLTSRFENVSRQVGAVHLHRVEQMSAVDGWSLLCKKVFTHGEEGEMEFLMDIGMKIVERCDGLPLAIKAIAGVLRVRDRSRQVWEEILHDQVWSSSIFPEDDEKRVMEALYLSYENLPPHLRQCFLYLSLFPEDYVFKLPYVVQQWIAEGFVRAEGSAHLEEVGREYFKELVARGLLQPELALIEDAKCKMHDLLRSLARFLAEGESFFGDISMLKDASPELFRLSKLRRLSIADGDVMIDLDELKTEECLRTLFLLKNQHGGLVVRQDFIKTHGHLRVLDLSEAHIEELPHCIGELTHLRYLNVSGTPIRWLPESIADLRNLLTLLLNNCRHIHTLPSGITQLKNLRCLEFYDGTELAQMPEGIRGLTQLRRLMDFVVDKHGGSLEELGPLVNLFVLAISKLERVSDKMQARKAAIKDKTSLIFLSLDCTLPIMGMSAQGLPCCGEEKEMRRMVDVFDELCPPPSLQVLNIGNYVGHSLPQWMWPSTGSSVFPMQNVTIIFLDCCFNFSQLPPLGLLPQLKQLSIKGAFAVKNLSPELSYPTLSTHSSHSSSDSTPTCPTTVLFPKLVSLTLIGMPNLEAWDWKREDKGERVKFFPCLQNLYMSDCPKMRSLPNCPLRGLKFMQIRDCPALTDVGDISAPESLLIQDNRSEGLPSWLGQVSVDPMDHESCLILRVRSNLLRRMLRQKERDDPEGDWHVTKRFPRVIAEATDEEPASFHYIKSPLFFSTNVQAAAVR